MKHRYLEAGKIVNTHGIAGEVKIMKRNFFNIYFALAAITLSCTFLGTCSYFWKNIE